MNRLSTETIQHLLTEARFLDDKPPEQHKMRRWGYPVGRCGMVSCAVGDMVLRGVIPRAIRRGDCEPLDGFDGISAAIGISRKEALWLFSWLHWKHDREYETPTQTAARIRKYVYYKMRKAEIFADYEEARRREGNWGVCEHVRELVETEA